MSPEERCGDANDDRYQMFSSWSISLVFHVVVLLLLMFLLSPRVPAGGANSERTAEIGIALKSRDDQMEKVTYDMLEDTARSEEAETLEAQTPSELADMPALGEISNLVSSDSTPSIPDVESLLPGLAPVSGDGSAGIPNVSEGLGNAATFSPGSLSGLGKGAISCFNTTGEGNRFAYVFDRSGSMDGPPIAAAKAELLRSLGSLQTNQQFQLVFYNHEPVGFANGAMILASTKNRREAYQFLASMPADGGTDHLLALRFGLAQHPDVLFFMTDADSPALSQSELNEIHDLAAGTQINAIQFGLGTEPTHNFLKTLAKMNGGQYMYIDTTQMRRRP